MKFNKKILFIWIIFFIGFGCFFLYLRYLPDYNKILMQLFRSIPKNIQNSAERAEYFEKIVLKEFKKKVKREGTTLSVRLSDNSWMVFSDVYSGTDQSMSFSFCYYYKKLGWYLLHIQYWEGDAYLMVNERSGKQILLDDLPIFSPNGKRIIVASLDLIAEYNPNSITAIDISNDSPKIIMRLTSNAWGASNVQWISNNEAFIEKNIYDDASNTYPLIGLVRMRF